MTEPAARRPLRLHPGPITPKDREVPLAALPPDWSRWEYMRQRAWLCGWDAAIDDGTAPNR